MIAPIIMTVIWFLIIWILGAIVRWWPFPWMVFKRLEWQLDRIFVNESSPVDHSARYLREALQNAKGGTKEIRNVAKIAVREFNRSPRTYACRDATADIFNYLCRQLRELADEQSKPHEERLKLIFKQVKNHFEPPPPETLEQKRDRIRREAEAVEKEWEKQQCSG